MLNESHAKYVPEQPYDFRVSESHFHEEFRNDAGSG